MATATLSSKFQISIPKEVRDGQNWKAGQRFVFMRKETGFLMLPVPEQSELEGIAKGMDGSDIRDRSDRF